MRISSDASGTELTSNEVQGRSKLTDAAHQFEAMLLQELLKPLQTEDGGWGGEEKFDGASDIITSFGTEAVEKSIS
jgi:peptidoglycan hydrolase FlgJ